MKPIKNFEEYYTISEKGEIYSIRSKKILKQTLKPNGYKYIELNVKGKVTYCRVHRLVAETYLNNSENKPFVNHKDGNKSNNSVDNLEWVTGTENNTHAVDNGLSKFIHNVYNVTTPDGKIIQCVGYKEVQKLCSISKNTVLKYSKSKERTKTGYLIERATTILRRSTAKRLEMGEDSKSL